MISKSLWATLPFLILKIISKSALDNLTPLLFKSSVIFLHHYGSSLFSTNFYNSSFSINFSTYFPSTPYPLWSYKSYQCFGILPILRRFSSSDESSESLRFISYFSSKYFLSFSFSSFYSFYFNSLNSDFFSFYWISLFSFFIS